MNETTMTLLKQLSDGKPHSLKNLTALFSYDTARLQAELATLQQQGFTIVLSSQKVKWQPQLPLLDHDFLCEKLHPRRLIFTPVTPSTNAVLMRESQSLNRGDLCLAEYQTAGRGRRDRSWFSPFAGQIIFSLYWRFTENLPAGISVVIGISVVQVLKSYGITDVGLKWPNDIWLNHRKLGGILIETIARPNAKWDLIIGLGLNISLPQQSPIDQAWIALNETGKHIDRHHLIISFVEKIDENLQLLEKNGLIFFQKYWQDYDIFSGKKVTVITDKEQFTGTAKGIDHQGCLLLQTPQGVLTFHSGDVSLRPSS